MASLTEEEAASLQYNWPFWARSAQLAPADDWRTWIILAGRMFGKTRAGAEWVRSRVEAGARSIVLIGRTVDDVRDTMIRGESGILNISPPWNRPVYTPSLRRLVWPSGAQALTYTAEKPDQMRGPNPDTAWCDELAAWQYSEMWDQLQFALRSIQSGLRPQVVVTTTPRPTPLVKAIIEDRTTVVTRGVTQENLANVDPATVEFLLLKYGGTRLGRQELSAELLDDVEGALWSRDMIDRARVLAVPRLTRVVVAIDPAVSSHEASDETGIVVVGRGENGHLYVLGDLSGRWTPHEWARKALGAMRDFRGDRIVAEINNGGALVEANLRAANANVSYKGVHASHGKRARAEPIASLYEQGRVHHVGSFARLEDQMCSWEPMTGQKSPDRLDALVWGASELALAPVAPYRNFSALSPR